MFYRPEWKTGPGMGKGGGAPVTKRADVTSHSVSWHTAQGWQAAVACAVCTRGPGWRPAPRETCQPSVPNVPCAFRAA